ncbi:MAG: oligoendopeptidase F [Clostridia bacterium]|nr:oligoendopeptidase F [Clostridia bacterium]
MSDRTPERSEIALRDTWKLEDIYPTQEAWEADFKKASELLAAFPAYEGRLGGLETLKEALCAATEINRLGESLYTYARMKRDEDNRKTEYQALSERAQSLLVQGETAMAFVQPELLAQPADYLQKAAAAPGFEDYRVQLQEIERQRPHTLSAAEERLIAMTGDMGAAPDTIFSMLSDADMKFPKVPGEDGELVELTHSSYIPLMMSRDRAVRRAAFAGMYETHKAFSATIPAIYGASVKSDVFYARAGRHESTLAARLFPDAVPEAVYTSLIETVHRHVDKLGQYMTRKGEQIGVDDMGMEDVYVPAVEGFDIKLPFDEAYALMIDCLSPLGEDYQAVLKKAREERWIDVYENAGKSSGAYSWGTYDSHPFVLMNYHPSLDSLLTIAHEMGHSMHSYYSNAAQPYTTAGYSLFVAEVASTTNECLVLMELMERYRDDKKAQAFIIAQLLENFRGTVFRQTMFAEFEREAHAMAERGEPLTVESLNGLYAGLNARYYPTVRQNELIAYEWMRIPHFYRAFYVYKYATGFSAAMALASGIRREGAPAVARYRKFLSLGCSMHPIDLLKVAGVDMSDPASVEAALTEFDALVDKYLELTKQ